MTIAVSITDFHNRMDETTHLTATTAIKRSWDGLSDFPVDELP